MKSCTRCGVPLAQDAPRGICNQCLTVAMQDLPTVDAETVATQVVVPSRSAVRANRLGPIQLIHRIGKGGMGEVWLGRHELLGRNVAVKFLTDAVAEEHDPAFKTFLAGARVAASLEHPGLNKVYDADVENGVPYLVLELLEGPNLSELIERCGPLDLATARAVLEAVAEAVAELNQRDLMHRDLKPSNIVLTTEGRVVVTDFGLACARPSADLGGVGLAGSPAYMAPEMFEGLISAKTDVYALGMTAYHLLAGRPAFYGDIDEQRRQHREAALDVEPLRLAGVPEKVVEVILRATSKDALFRPKSTRHVLLALSSAFEEAGVKPATPDQLGRMLKKQNGPSVGESAKDTGSKTTSSLSSIEAIAEMAARKRDLRAAARLDTPKPLPLPPLWKSVGPDVPKGMTHKTETGSYCDVEKTSTQPQGRATDTNPAVLHRTERRTVWIARLVASAAGALATLIEFMIYKSRWDQWVGIAVHGAGKTIPFMAIPGASPFWDGLLLILMPFGIMWMIAVGGSTLIYRRLRGEPLPTDTENIRCGWCQHVLRGITTLVCAECGHRIGDQGPDEHGIVPLGHSWGRRIMGWLTYPLCFLIVTGLIKIIASLFIFGILVLVHPSHGTDVERSYGFAFVILLLGLATTLAFYEGFLLFNVTHSGRAWCRVCKAELKDLTEPVCPACHTRI